MEAFFILLAVVVPFGVIGAIIWLILKVHYLQSEIEQLKERPYVPSPISDLKTRQPAEAVETSSNDPIRVVEPAREPEKPLETAPASISVSKTTSTASDTGSETHHHISLLDRLTDIRLLIWIGGLALALGGIFVVKYSIEYGLLGPWGRIAAGMLTGIAMLAAGDWFRRQPEQAARLTDWQYLPLAVSGAGFTTLYGAIFAGFSFYGLFPPLVAVLLMAAVAAAGLAYSLLLGPVLAILSLVGAYAVPLLVSTGSRSTELLYLYLAAVLAGSFMLLRFRPWPWIGGLNLAFSFVWFLIWVAEFNHTSASIMVLNLYFAGLLALFIYQFAGRVDRPVRVTSMTLFMGIADSAIYLSYGALLLVGFAGVVMTTLPGGYTAAILLPALLLPVTAWLASRDSYLEGTLWIGQVVMLLALYFWPAYQFGENGINSVLIITAILTGLFYCLLAFYRHRHQDKVFLGTLYAVIMPLLLFCLLYWKYNKLGISLEWSLVALILASGYVGAARYLARQAVPLQDNEPVGLLALGATGGLSLAFAAGLEAEWLTIAFALQVAAMGWIYQKIPVALFRPMASLLVIIVIVRTLLDSELAHFAYNTSYEVSWYVWYLYTFGLPLVAFAAAWYWFSRVKEDYLNGLLESGIILFWLGLLSQMAHRFMADEGHLSWISFTPEECAVQMILWLLNALALYWLSTRRPGRVRELAWQLLLAAGLLLLLGGMVLVLNPLIVGTAGGWYLINWLSFTYLLPSGIALLWLKILRPQHRKYATWIKNLAGSLVFLYLNLEIRYVFNGVDMEFGPASDAEIYTYSVGWILFAAAAMVYGIWWHSRAARQTALLLLLATVVKVFVFDMSALDGLLRALSFLGLGGSLIGLAFLYQRFGKKEISENS